MGATHDNDIVVNVYGAATPVKRQSFGVLMIASVEASFTPDTYKLYASPQEAAADADLSATGLAAVQSFFSQPNHPRVVGVAAVTLATLGTDLTALLAEYSDFYAVACVDRTQAYQDDLADWALANNRFAFVQSSDTTITAGTAGNLFLVQQALSNNRAMGLWHDTDTEYGDTAWAAAFLWPDPDVKSSVAYDKTLTGITAVPDMTSAELAAILAADGNAYLTLRGIGATAPGKTFSGIFADDQLVDDWFKARLGEDLAQLKLNMSNRGEKIPYTNIGLAMIESVIKARLQTAFTIGHLDPAQGYIIDVPDISDVDLADILARQCTVSVTAYRSGGIYQVTANVGLINA